MIRIGALPIHEPALSREQRVEAAEDVTDPANVHQLRGGPTCRICLDAYLARVAGKTRVAS